MGGRETPIWVEEIVPDEVMEEDDISAYHEDEDDSDDDDSEGGEEEVEENVVVDDYVMLPIKIEENVVVDDSHTQGQIEQLNQQIIALKILVEEGGKRITADKIKLTALHETSEALNKEVEESTAAIDAESSRQKEIQKEHERLNQPEVYENLSEGEVR